MNTIQTIPDFTDCGLLSRGIINVVSTLHRQHYSKTTGYSWRSHTVPIHIREYAVS